MGRQERSRRSRSLSRRNKSRERRTRVKSRDAKIPRDIVSEIYSFVLQPPMKLKSWVPLDVIEHIYELSQNPSPGAMSIIESFIEANGVDYYWWVLSSNPSAIHILEKYPEMIDWEELSSNEGALHLLQRRSKQRKSGLDWWRLSANPGVVPILERELLESREKGVKSRVKLSIAKNPNALHLFDNFPLTSFLLTSKFMEYAFKNPNPAIVPMIQNYIKKNYIHLTADEWANLSSNPATIPILKRYPEKIDWKYLSRNPSPEATKMLRENYEESERQGIRSKVNWWEVSEVPTPEALALRKEFTDKIGNDFYLMDPLFSNPAAIHLIEKYITTGGYVDYYENTLLAKNENIFEVDNEVYKIRLQRID